MTETLPLGRKTLLTDTLLAGTLPTGNVTNWHDHNRVVADSKTNNASVGYEPACQKYVHKGVGCGLSLYHSPSCRWWCWWFQYWWYLHRLCEGCVRMLEPTSARAIQESCTHSPFTFTIIHIHHRSEVDTQYSGSIFRLSIQAQYSGSVFRQRHSV